MTATGTQRKLKINSIVPCTSEQRNVMDRRKTINKRKNQFVGCYSGFRRRVALQVITKVQANIW